MGAGWHLIYQLVQDVSALFNSTLPSRWRWRYVYVWISQWIYYNRLSGPVRQAGDPGSGLAILIGHVSLCYRACHLLWDDWVTKYHEKPDAAEKGGISLWRSCYDSAVTEDERKVGVCLQCDEGGKGTEKTPELHSKVRLSKQSPIWLF